MKVYEVAIVMFGACNLSCKFCLAGDVPVSQEVDYSTFSKIADSMVDQVCQRLISRNDIDHISIKVQGGEPFIDRFSDDHYQAYINMVQDIQKRLPVESDVVFLSNGIFKDTNRVFSVLEQLNAEVAFSYDPVSRFETQEQIEQYKKNVEFFYSKQMFNSFSATLTGPNMRAYSQGKSLIDWMNERFSIDVCPYLYGPSWQTYYPKQQDYDNFLLWAIKNRHFCFSIVHDLMLSLIPDMPTPKKICYCENQFTGFFILGADKMIASTNCYNDMPAPDKEKFFGIKAPADIHQLRQKMRIKLGCYQCERYERCPQFCPTSCIAKYHDKCPYRNVIPLITEEDKDAFRQYEQLCSFKR